MADKIIIVEAEKTKIVKVGYSKFTSLLDTPDDLSGQAGKSIIVNAAADELEFGEPQSGGGQLGDPVDKTIAAAAIDLAAGEHVVNLTGEGDIADILSTIGKTGGGELGAGHEVVLKGKASLAYTITIEDGTYFHLQADFPISGEYDNITLLSLGAGHWMEKGSRNWNG